MIRWRLVFWPWSFITGLGVLLGLVGAPPMVLSWWKIVCWSAVVTGLIYLLAEYEDGKRDRVKRCACGVPMGVSHYCSAGGHCWIGKTAEEWTR